MLIGKTFDSFTKAVKSLHGEFSATPEPIVKEMFSKLDKINWENPNLKILDPAAGFGTFLREAYIKLKEFHTEDHILNNMLYACEISGFKNIFLEKKMGLRNIYNGDFLEMVKIDNWPDKFDIVIANPPYKNKLDLKFLNKAFDIVREEIVFVHPSSFIVDQKNSLEIYNTTLQKIGLYIRSIKLFNGNGIFDIGLYVPCSITHISKKESSNYFQFDYPQYKQSFQLENSKICEISVFGYNKHFTSIKNKISKFLQKKEAQNLETCGYVLGSGKENQRFLRNSDSFFIEMSHITAGNNRGEHVKPEDPIHKNDFFIAISKYQTVIKRGGSPKFNIWFEFDSNLQATNFLNYLKTDFFRICLSLSKTNQNLARGEFRMVPWLDFTQEWDDKKLYKYFEINKEEQAFIKKVIPNWYD